MMAVERLTMLDAFTAVCEKYGEWKAVPQKIRASLIRRMERSCFEYTINTCIIDGIDRLFSESKFVQRYSMNCYRILTNINNNPALIKKIIDGSVVTRKIAELTNYELHPEASEKERAEIKLRQQQKIQSKVSRAYWCKKCEKNETISIEYQAAALDEGTSYSIKCVHCEYVWRT